MRDDPAGDHLRERGVEARVREARPHVAHELGGQAEVDRAERDVDQVRAAERLDDRLVLAAVAAELVVHVDHEHGLRRGRRAPRRLDPFAYHGDRACEIVEVPSGKTPRSWNALATAIASVAPRSGWSARQKLKTR